MIVKTPPSGKLWSTLFPSKKVVPRWNASAFPPWRRGVQRVQRLIALLCGGLLHQLCGLRLRSSDVRPHHVAIPDCDPSPPVALALEIIDIRLQGDDLGVTWLCDDGRNEQAEE